MGTGRRLATWVVLDGQAYGPHSDLTPEQAARITNALAWADDAPAGDGNAPSVPTGQQHVDPEPTALPAPPPRAGKGSGLDAWAAFARSQQIDVAEAADRAAIIAACEKCGVIDPVTE